MKWKPGSSFFKRKQKRIKDIAIVGMACRFPGASDKKQFWNNLLEKRSSIVEIPEDRWNWRTYYGDPKTGYKSNSKWGGFLENVDQFDASFFKISAREADLMDPQQRLLLELAWHCLEDAGYAPSLLRGSSTGVFIGACNLDYKELLERSQARMEGHAATGTYTTLLPNRISHFFGFHGPSVPIDTSCSASLVALHQAVMALRNGECEWALAGGVNLMLTPTSFVSFSKLGMLSPTGSCKAFDKRADGYVRGEGGAVLLLKPLAKAEAAGDRIYGVIKGSATNHGGGTRTLTTPDPVLQAALIVQACKDGEVDPEQFTYIETHGSGTELGDPIEVLGLKKAFKELYRRRGKPMSPPPYCGLSSVKTNIGHLEGAAGIAGVVKVLLALQAKKLPGTVHFEEQNPIIDFASSPFFVVRETREWETRNDKAGKPLPRLAGVSSFGFGGTNAHIIIEEYCPKNSRYYTSRTPALIPLSAKKEHLLIKQVRNLKHFLENDRKANLHDVAYTLQTGREQMEARLAIVAHSCGELLDQLDLFLEGETADLFYSHTETNKPRLLQQEKEEHVFSKKILDAKEIRLLAQRWVTGVSFDWQQWYTHQRPGKISLPNYPFEHKRYWFSDQAGVEKQVSLYPPDVQKSMAKATDIAREHTRGPRIRLTTTEGLDAPARQETKPSPWKSSRKRELGDRGAVQRPNKKKIASVLSDLLCQLLYLEKNELDRKKPFKEMGVDSVISAEFIDSINKAFPVNFKTSVLFDHPCFNDLAAYLEGVLADDQLKLVGPAPDEESKHCPSLQAATIFHTRAIKGDLASEDSINFHYEIGMDNNACLRDHLVFGACVLSLDAFVELISTACHEYFGTERLYIQELRIDQPLVGEVGTTSPVQLKLKEMSDGRLRLMVSTVHGKRETTHIRGYVRVDAPAGQIQELELTSTTGLEDQSKETIDALLPHIKARGIYSGLIQSLKFSRDFAVGTIQLAPAILQSRIAQLLDGALRCAMSYGPYLLEQDAPEKFPSDVAWLPHKVSRIAVHHITGTQSYNFVVRPVRVHEKGVLLNIDVNGADGQPVVQVRGLQLHPVNERQLLEKYSPEGLKKRTETPPAFPRKKVGPRPGKIAVIGLSCRFPGAANSSDFWGNLRHGKDSVEEVSENRWGGDYSWYHPEMGQKDTAYTKWGGFVVDSDKFDPLFFGISPREAEIMDPQQRLFLEGSWKAIEDAGYDPTQLKRRKIGVFVGAGPGDYLYLMQQHHGGKSAAAFTGSSQAILAARISYLLNLTGPAFAIDTACSSSLVAIDRAYKSLLSGECEMALAGGIKLMTTPTDHIWTSQAGMASPEGRCKAFDEKADGMVSSEGVGVLVLKPLEDAERDGDRIYGVILGSGINQDGRTNGITAPSARSQHELQLSIYEEYGIDPSTLTYVEAHGTGTKLGDPIEVEALTRSFRHYSEKNQYCALGSVKTNIGHAGFSAGVAGVIKVLLMMQHRKYVPSLHFHEVNRALEISNSPFYINTQLKDWIPPDKLPRRASVSSFGFSGTNAHLVMEEYQPPERPPYTSTEPAIVLLSARNEERLREQAQNLLRFLEQYPQTSHHDIAYTLQIGRTSMEERLAIVAQNSEKLARSLNNYLEGQIEGFMTGNINRDKTDFILEGIAGKSLYR